MLVQKTIALLCRAAKKNHNNRFLSVLSHNALCCTTEDDKIKKRAQHRGTRDSESEKKKGKKKEQREKRSQSLSNRKSENRLHPQSVVGSLFSLFLFFFEFWFCFCSENNCPKDHHPFEQRFTTKENWREVDFRPLFFFLCCCCRRFSFLIPSQLECLIALQQHRRHGRPEHQETARDIAPIRGHPALHPSDAIGSAHAAAQHSARAACTTHRGLDVDSALQDEPDADAVDVLALPADAWHCALGVAAPHQVVQPCCCQFVVAAFVF